MMGPNYTQEQADDLIARFLSGNISPDEQAALTHWINATAENQSYFLQLRDAWQATAREGNYDAGAAWDSLQYRTAIEAPLAVNKWKYYFRVAASYTLPFLIGGGLVYAWASGKKDNNSNALVTVTSPKGATTKIELSDGTEVWLNAGSKLQYAQSYNLRGREVKLEGEAFFKVHTNAQKPFTVRASDLSILALGTSFNVKAYPEDKTVVTTLVDGEVKIDGSKTTTPFGLMMKPHQHVVYKKPLSTNDSEQPKTPVSGGDSSTAAPIESREVNNTEIYTAWKDGNWIVAAQTMDELAVTMERRFNVKVIFKEQELKEYRFSGTFRQETLEQVLNILKLTAPLKYTIDKGVVTLALDEELREKYNKAFKTR
ncbi:FecR family protein [Chitinophaga ginsengisegetis]|nr:FecR domain-containing protein [Chitinophaga ginsengisegetis]MDR6566328.1 ferric-dicitrate binding protein FerR (iron transport regulator) [Chitinophaga ginsengisegetis]MDR6646058.1 ferric-dicitrate binding protein FerR (iron transport regulator) [Chitinophaga ginsengisegetis]MDR6651350.1 ferric-dicitrate binding protein FerR (iron transport regulator) [Chitinophaga ginsengisegetis]